MNLEEDVEGVGSRFDGPPARRARYARLAQSLQTTFRKPRG
jgi:hypothetical protein